jgi:small subunit ribosomal protein S8
VDIPASKIKIQIARILKDEGYIKNFKVIKDNRQGLLLLYLKFDEKNQQVLSNIQRVSRSSRRVYAQKDNLPKVLNGMGLAILTTSKGVMTEREARKHGVGGEVICTVW